MTNQDEKEKHRKHLEYKIKERRQRSSIAKTLLTDPQFRQQKGPRREDLEDRQYRKYKKLEPDEDESV